MCSANVRYVSEPIWLRTNEAQALYESVDMQCFSFWLCCCCALCMYASTYSPNVCVVYTPTHRFRKENKTFTRISKTPCAPAQESNSGWQRIQSAGISFIPSIHTFYRHNQALSEAGTHIHKNHEEAPRIFVVTPGKKSEFSLRSFAAVHSRGFNFCLRVCR